MIVVRGVPVSEDEAAELARRLGAHHDQRCMRAQARNKRGAGVLHHPDRVVRIRLSDLTRI
jgi:hypothetical protein